MRIIINLPSPFISALLHVLMHVSVSVRNFHVFEEIGVEEHDDFRPDFRPEVEIWPYCACAIKNMKFNPNLNVCHT